MWKKRIPPGEKVPLKLTPTETKAILEELMCLDRQYEQAIQDTPTGKPVMMTLDDLEDFAGYIAAEANHTEDKKLGRKVTVHRLGNSDGGGCLEKWAVTAAVR